MGKKTVKNSESVCLIISIYIYRCCPGLRRTHDEKGSFGKIISGGTKKKKERENGSAPKHTLLLRSIQKAPLFSISRKEHHQNQIISSSVDVLYSCCQDQVSLYIYLFLIIIMIIIIIFVHRTRVHLGLMYGNWIVKAQLMRCLVMAFTPY